MKHDLKYNNFSLYFARLCRHLIETKEHEDIISFWDLSHSLRCLHDIKNEIDEFFTQQNYICNFNHVVNRRKLKKEIHGGISLFEETETQSGTILALNFTEEKLDDRAILDFKYEKPLTQHRTMTFTNWLGSEIAIVKSPTCSLTISRSTLICRIANKFSGSHPYETVFNLDSNKDLEDAYRYIDWLQCIKLPNVQYGYLLIQDFSIDLALAFLPYFLRNKTRGEFAIFDYCNKLLTQDT